MKIRKFDSKLEREECPYDINKAADYWKSSVTDTGIIGDYEKRIKIYNDTNK